MTRGGVSSLAMFRLILIDVVQGTVITGSHDPVGMTRLGLGLHQKFIDVRFTVRHGHKMRIGSEFRLFMALPHHFDPALAFFLLDRCVLPSQTLSLSRLRNRRLIVTCPYLRTHRPQWRAVGRKSVQGMQEQSTPCPAIQGAGAPHLLVRSGQINLCRILRKNDGRLLGHAPARRLHVGLHDVVEIDLVVIEKSVGCGHLSISLASQWNARRRMSTTPREDFDDAVVQPRVLQVHTFHLIDCPW